jgi:NADPH-dependent curcumin reductase CurA
MKVDLRKIYRFDPVPRNDDGSLPKGGNVYYECTGCKVIVASVSHIKAACECGNISGGGGASEVKDSAQVNPLRGTLK